MKAEYQSDWLHPSDAGYQKMAETAAALLAK
jgi:lysophospholipase L1-like esterase